MNFKTIFKLPAPKMLLSCTEFCKQVIETSVKIESADTRVY